IDFYIFRLSSPVSAAFNRMPQTVVRKWIEQGISGKPILVYGKGRRTQNFIATSDISSIYNYCINHHCPSGIYTVASANSISMESLARIISKHFNVPLIFEGEDSLENERWNISIEKAKRELNYNPQFDSE